MSDTKHTFNIGDRVHWANEAKVPTNSRPEYQGEVTGFNMEMVVVKWDKEPKRDAGFEAKGVHPRALAEGDFPS